MKHLHRLRTLVLLTMSVAMHTAWGQLPAPPVSPAPVVNRDYFAGGQPKTVIQAPGQSGFHFTTRYGYDQLGRHTSITDAALGVVDLGYGGRDALTSVTDPRRLITNYDRDGFDQVRGLTSPDTGTAQSSLDAAGNLLTRTDSRGVQATYAYDPLDRPTSVTYSRAGSASQVLSWSYDGTATENTFGKGRLTGTTYAAGSTSYGYDPEGRLTLAVQRHSGLRELAGVVQTVRYEYDAGGRLSRLTYPSGRVLNIGYTGGLPSSLTLFASESATQGQPLLGDITFEPFGAVRSWQWLLGGAALPHERVFDTYGRLVRYRLGAHVRDLAYDEADRITRYTHYEAGSGNAVLALDQTFGYDELGRLTSAAVNGVTWTFTYDANGNRRTHAANGITRNYDVSTTSNRLLGLDNPSRALTYDATGNVTSDNEALGTAAYDLSGRLTSVTRAGVITTYMINAMGQRVRKDTSARSGERLMFAYDSAGHLLGEYDYSGQAVREYVWLGDTPVAVFLPGTLAADPPRVYAIHADHLDAPRVVVDAANGVRWRWLSDPFGVYGADENPAGFGAFTMPLRFPGQYFDRETGVHYNWNRDYDGGTGRYVQSDPIGLAGGINTYGYVGGNPLSFSDPLGLQAQPNPAPPSSPNFPPAANDPRYGPRLIPGTGAAPSLWRFPTWGGPATVLLVLLATPSNIGQDYPTFVPTYGPANDPAYNVIPFPAPPERECPPDDGCKLAQNELLRRRLLIDALQRQGFLDTMGEYRRLVAPFNKDVDAHNARCPSHRVEKLPLGPGR